MEPLLHLGELNRYVLGDYLAEFIGLVHMLKMKYVVAVLLKIVFRGT